MTRPNEYRVTVEVDETVFLGDGDHDAPGNGLIFHQCVHLGRNGPTATAIAKDIVRYVEGKKVRTRSKATSDGGAITILRLHALSEMAREDVERLLLKLFDLDDRVEHYGSPEQSDEDDILDVVQDLRMVLEV